MRNLDRSKVKQARILRKRMTGSERTVWYRLRNKGIGFQFRRQHPIAGYVLDFYCDQAKLCLEIDGIQHQAEGFERDLLRDSKLEELGIKTIRVSNYDAVMNWDQCLEEILALCLARCEPGPDGSGGR